MNRQEIIESVLNYVKNDKAQYAILINGEWGSGKTYLYENYLMEEIFDMEAGKQDSKANVYISLYGIANVEQLAKELLSNYMINVVCSKDEFKKKVYKLTSGVIGIASKAVSLAASANKASAEVTVDLNSIVEAVRDKIQAKGMIVCLDDLERCAIPVNVLFGFINNLVEHCNCKVIVLADESNIGKMYANTNLEMKYSTLLANRKLVEKKEGTEQEEKECLTIDEIKTLNEKVYSQNYFYKDIKEKVIGMTLLYTPDFDECFESVLDSVVDIADLKDVLINQKKFVLDCFEQCPNRNIRIMKNWLYNFQNMFRALKQYSQDYEYYDEILENFIRYSIRIAYAIGNNISLMEWKNDAQYGQVMLKDSFLWKNEGYRFIDDLFVTNSVNEIRMCQAARYINDTCVQDDIKMKENEKRFSKGIKLGELSAWDKYEDNEIHKMQQELKQEIEDNEYVPQNYQHIIGILVELETVGLCSLNLQEISAMLVEKIEKYEGKVEIENFQRNFTDDMLRKFNYYYGPIYDAALRKNKLSDIISINDFLINKDLEGFCEYCQNNRTLFFERKTFIRYVDMEKFISFIEQCKIDDIYKIIRVIHGVYNFSNAKECYGDDVGMLQELKKQISAIKWEGVTRKKVQKSFCDTLENIIKEINEGE